MTILFIEKICPRALQGESEQNLKRWKADRHTPSKKTIKEIIKRVAQRPGLGGKAKSADIEDLFNLGPLDIPLWDALANEPYSIIEQNDKLNNTLINLVRYIRYWHLAVERLQFDFNEKSMHELDTNYAALRLALRRAERATSIYPQAYPFTIKLQEVIDLLLKQLEARLDPVVHHYLKTQALINCDNSEGDDMAILCPDKAEDSCDDF